MGTLKIWLPVRKNNTPLGCLAATPASDDGLDDDS